MILIDDDRLAEALLGLSQENHYHDAEYYAHVYYTSAKAAMDKLAA